MINSVTGQYSKQHGFQFTESHYIDFIIQSSKNFYYVQDSRDLMNSQNLTDIFVNVIKKDLVNSKLISNQKRGQIGKIPYLYQSFLKENSLRFPIIFNNETLVCGYGRAIVATRYFPQITLPGIIISNTDLSYYKIKDINDLMSIIVEYPYWKNKNLTNVKFGFGFDEDDIIHATDYQDINDEKFLYKFIEDAGTQNDLWDKIMSIINSYSDINDQTVLEIFDQLIKI